MKNINKIIAASIIGLTAGLYACDEPFDLDAKPSTTGSTYSANVLLVNASPDAPQLDFYVNNLKVGSSVSTGVSQTGYTNVPITSNGVFANTNIRAKATSGTIGGVLKSSDIIYRSSNNGTGNFQASNGGNYTLIVVDTLNRPVPTRTLDAGNFGATTYYSAQSSFTAPKIVGTGDTTITLNVGSNNSVVTYNLVKKYNGNVNPSFLIPIGIVPLGSSDVGGPRFLLLTDALVTPAAGKFAVRFVNASPDAGAVTATVNGTTVASNSAYPLLTTAGFNPTVGSRSATVAFTNNFGTAASYDIVVKIGSTQLSMLSAYPFADGGVYTIVFTGTAKTGYFITVAKNK